MCVYDGGGVTEVKSERMHSQAGTCPSSFDVNTKIVCTWRARCAAAAVAVAYVGRWRPGAGADDGEYA